MRSKQNHIIWFVLTSVFTFLFLKFSGLEFSNNLLLIIVISLVGGLLGMARLHMRKYLVGDLKGVNGIITIVGGFIIFLLIIGILVYVLTLSNTLNLPF